uniref:Amine oxidase domain-containing protein n=1 Tax=Chromera velia CCMP2878 TaxID=1169474 RepID=A0A0G4HVV4_9ALVE|eukprot:Cvel_8936.t1-p1 / transcript=Cvel_8936.t1 / gene=Cvel_8936 / organism=Chromera_velia_CCMP2878 / gene_product=Putative all-trans-retinol 13,14-reductase, putative / transcript_product=Putative all-trans-retinol 13,14-reductase, putative / location=Cvel_scaffold503:28936-34100(+) / protein_length=716 / sequence_SO=supercontig / SO=protein_coding / is_pseudo=false
MHTNELLLFFSAILALSDQRFLAYSRETTGSARVPSGFLNSLHLGIAGRDGSSRRLVPPSLKRENAIPLGPSLSSRLSAETGVETVAPPPVKRKIVKKMKKKQDEPLEYDAVVIGSGIGGLTTASVLAKVKNYKVLVLEQHYKAGGFTHSFRREGGKFEWDPGLHYVGEMKDGETLKNVFDFVTGGRVQWEKMADPFDRFLFPEFEFGVSSNPKQFEQDLIRMFPAEAEGIKKYFVLLNQYKSMRAIIYFPRPVASMVRLWYNRLSALLNKTTKEAMDHLFSDERLKAILCGQWGDHGEVPSKSSFRMHCVIAAHYLDGGWYPRGGAETIAKAAKAEIESKGGKVMLSARVEEILMEPSAAAGSKGKKDKSEGMRTRGVRVRKGRAGGNRFETLEVKTREVYSDAGLHNTFTKMLPERVEECEETTEAFKTIRTDLQKVGMSPSSVCLFCGLKGDPEHLLGQKGGNLWIYSQTDHESVKKDASEWASSIPQGKAPPLSTCFVSFPSKRDGRYRGGATQADTEEETKQNGEHPEGAGEQPKGDVTAASEEAEESSETSPPSPRVAPKKFMGHTAEVITFVPGDAFAKWSSVPPAERGETYEKVKKELTEKLLALVEPHCPGFSDAVVFKEISTPLAYQWYANSPTGAAYGLPRTLEVDLMRTEGRLCAGGKTPVAGLIITGADLQDHGIGGAMMGGLQAVMAQHGVTSILKILGGRA